jgi:hypothetical protein
MLVTSTTGSVRRSTSRWHENVLSIKCVRFTAGQPPLGVKCQEYGVREISVSDDGEYEDDSLLGYTALQSHISRPTFRRQYAPLKRLSTSATLHGAISQKAVIFNTKHVCRQNVHKKILSLYRTVQTAELAALIQTNSVHTRGSQTVIAYVYLPLKYFMYFRTPSTRINSNIQFGIKLG